MRQFSDADGRAWEVWVGRESWGVMVALLVPRVGGPVRRALLPSPGPEEAERDIASMDIQELSALLARSEIVD